MKTLFDTSLLVAAIVDSHKMHEKAFPWLAKAKAGEFELVIASHTLAELYSVLSSLPLQRRISPSIAWKLIHENLDSLASFVSLTPVEYRSTISQVAEAGLAGGVIYDALIARVAQKAKVERLLTFNLKHFQKVWTGDQKVLCSP